MANIIFGRFEYVLVIENSCEKIGYSLEADMDTFYKENFGRVCL